MIFGHRSMIIDHRSMTFDPWNFFSVDDHWLMTRDHWSLVWNNRPMIFYIGSMILIQIKDQKPLIIGKLFWLLSQSMILIIDKWFFAIDQWLIIDQWLQIPENFLWSLINHFDHELKAIDHWSIIRIIC